MNEKKFNQYKLEIFKENKEGNPEFNRSYLFEFFMNDEEKAEDSIREKYKEMTNYDKSIIGFKLWKRM